MSYPREFNKWALVAFVLGSLMPMTLAFGQTLRTSTEANATIDNSVKTDQVGVGAQVGVTTGLSVDYWYSTSNSVSASLVDERGNFGVGLAHLWMYPELFATADFIPYVGAGALMAFGNHSDYFADRTDTFAIAAQIPLGVHYLPRAQRYGIFAEVKPSLALTQTAYGFLDADVGARFYF